MASSPYKWGGGALNHSYHKVFTKYNQDLAPLEARSRDLVAALKPLLPHCHTPIKILTDNPAFHYGELGLGSRDILQVFGALPKDSFDLAQFMQKSNSKNPKYFSHANFIALRKDSQWFDASKVKNPNEQNYLDTMEALRDIEAMGWRRVESEYFYIYAKNDC